MSRTDGCWAASLDDCQGALSREHIVSDSVLSRMIVVQGLSWCREAPKKVGAASFVAKHLCRGHNSRLTRYDSAALAFLNTLNAAFEGTLHTPARLDGFGLERWVCKTLVNVALVNERDSSIPTDALALHLWRGEPFEHPYGLSFAVKTGMTVDWTQDQISIVPLFRPEGTTNRDLLGALLTFRSFRFVFLVPGAPLPNGWLPLAAEHPDWDGLQLNWHNEGIGLGPAKSIQISWEAPSPTNKTLIGFR